MLRWGIAGTGFISDTMARAIARSAGSQIVADSGQNAGRLAGFADRFGIVGRYLRYEDVLRDPGVDAAHIGLPNHLHHEAVNAAAGHGKMIVSEKPLLTTLAEAEVIGSGRPGGDTRGARGLCGGYLAGVNPQGRGAINNLAIIWAAIR